MLLYAQAKLKTMADAQTASVKQDIRMLSSGLFFAVATLMRSNGLLSGSIFLYDVATYLPRTVSAQLSLSDIRRITVSCAAGTMIGLGFIGPQYLAYARFCSGEESRPWCEKTPPSIYSWVQSHYWYVVFVACLTYLIPVRDVGLFRYWTLSNLPLFLLAAPVLWLLFASSVTILRSCADRPLHWRPVPRISGTSNPRNGSSALCKLPELALPQLLLAVAAATTFHVQIVNRIASGYPIWYLAMATWLDGRQTTPSGKHFQQAQWFSRGFMVYALVQGMLYANFLPPA
jgi:phosphatidylinositol glycan class V